MKKNNKKKSSGRRLRDILLSPAATIAMFALAAILLLISGIGGARATLTYFSETLASQYGMYHIGVTLMENGQDVSYRNYSGESDGSWDEATGVLLGHMLEKKDKDGNAVKDEDGNVVLDDLKIGAAYKEQIRARNSSGENTRDNAEGINQFVRISLYKYWTDKEPNDPDAKKLPDLDPSVIDLHLVNTSGDGAHWIIDEKASTDERTVAYYSALLKNGEETVDLTDTLTIKEMVARKVTQSVKTTDNGKTITTTYDYDGKCFCIEATVDAVQQNNANEAIPSAWGRNVKISGSGDDLTLSLE